MTTAKDATAADALIKAAIAKMSAMTYSDLAASAYVQGMMAQAATQALVNILKTTNIASPALIERALADAYTECARGLGVGLLLPPATIAAPH